MSRNQFCFCPQKFRLIRSMPTWDSSQYLRFAEERTQPAIDLAARVTLATPVRIIDLGCGPGNSTAVLARRWPQADLTGLDSSAAMLTTARHDFPQLKWQVGDIASWEPDHAYDLIYANAALQWVSDHRALLPRLFGQVAPDGALAFQVPANQDGPPHRLMRELARSPYWSGRFIARPREWQAEAAESYYDMLSPRAARIDLWVTEYIHVLPDAAAIVDWYRGTGLRPWLEALSSGEERDDFIAAYTAEISRAYPARPDGRVLFPFRRLFVIAYR